jgi:Pentapeptide repeats (8 copies)
MTLRDWLPILISLLIPCIVAYFGWQVSWRLGKLEDQRAQAERKLAEQRAQDEALQAYLDQMGNLLLEKDLRDSDKDSEVRTLARARTLTVLRRLDASRKGEIMQFLLEAHLVRRVGEKTPVIELDRADLSDVDLNEVDMSGAHLSEANLTNTDLRRTDLSGAYLRHANLSFSDLSDADLSGAKGVRKYQLDRVEDLTEATMPNGQKYEDWFKSRKEDGG